MPNAVAQMNQIQILTDRALMFRPPNLHAQEIFLPMPVALEVGEYTQYDRDLFVLPDDLRADGTESNKSEIGWKYVPYQTKEHALHDVITDRMRKNHPNEALLENLKTEALKRKVLNRLEYDAVQIMTNTANNSYSTALGSPLDNLDTASPHTFIQQAVDAVELNCGLAANTIAAAPNVLRAITRTTEWKEERWHMEDLTLNDGIPDEMYGLKVIPFGSQVSTNNKGQTKVPTSRLFGVNIWVGYVAPEEMLGPEMLSYGATIFTEEYAWMWYEKALKGDKLEFGKIYVLKQIAKECGGLLTGAM